MTGWHWLVWIFLIVFIIVNIFLDRRRDRREDNDHILDWPDSYDGDEVKP